MAGIDITSLFADVVGPNPEQQLAERTLQQNDAANQASLVGELGGMAAYLAPQRGRAMAAAGKGLLGIDTRTKADKLKEQLEALGTPSTPQEHKAYADLLDKMRPGSGVQYMMGVAQEKRQQQLADASTANAAANATSSAASLLNAQTEANTPVSSPDVWYEADGRLYNRQTGEWSTADGGKPKYGVAVSTLDQDLYEPNSWFAFESSLSKATNDKEAEAAWAKLLPNGDMDGWKWKLIPEEFVVAGGPLREKMPDTNNMVTIRKEIDAANRAGDTQREQSGQIANLMGTMIESVETGKTKTGMKGIILSVLPQSGNYAFQGDLNTVLANLGLGALTEARNNSVNGASGFGQLTEKELLLLQRLEADLKVGLDKETLIKRLNEVKLTFADASARAYSSWTTRQWIGYEDPPESTTPNTPNPNL
jgi:hypothetical protein